MGLLDMRTIIFIHVVIDLVCTLVLLLLWHQSRKRFAGTGLWVLDFVFQTAALFLIILRGSIPDWMSMVLSNTLLIAGVILGYVGLVRFAGEKISQVHNYVLLAAFACVHAYFALVQSSLAARTLNLSVGILIICFQRMWFLLYGVKPGMRRFTFGVAMANGASCLVSTARIIGFFNGTLASNDLFQPGVFESFIVIAYQMVFIFFTYSLVLMVNKRLLAEVKTEEEKFAKAFRSSPYAMMLTRISDGQIFEVNDGFLNTCGYEYADAIGKKTVDLNLWDREEDRLAALHELSKTGKMQGREFQFRKKSGELMTGIFSAEIIPINNQEFVLSSIRDITERKRAELALQESRAALQKSHDEMEQRVRERTGNLAQAMGALKAEHRRLHEVLNMLPAYVLLLAPDYRVTFANRFFEERFGKSEGRRCYEYLFNRTESCENCETYQVFKTNEPHRWEWTGPDGGFYDISDFPFTDVDGSPLIMEVGLDITERKHAEAAVQKECAKREKAEQQLLQTQKLESIGTLAGGIAHDLNNTLGPIVINSELALLDLPRESNIRQNLELILKSGMRGRDLVRQVLLFSRKSEKTKERVALIPVIKESFKLLRSSIPATIQMKLQLETDSDTVYGDPSQIQQVIMNLCTNAAYAMRTMGCIDISLQGVTFGSHDVPEPDMEPGDYLVLSVKDTGCGMDEGIRKRVFEPFFTTKPVGEGTGLGLSVVYGIVKNHRGNITVYSEPGRGSIFRVYLPKLDTSVSVEAETLKPIPRGNERILLVDDEESIINSVRNLLQHLGYKVTAMMDSREALKIFSADPFRFDLVITDQTMPFLTGETLGKEMMRLRADIPVILCTGYSDNISAEKAKQLAFRGFIMKPFTLREGAEFVRHVLDQKKTRDR